MTYVIQLYLDQTLCQGDVDVYLDGRPISYTATDKSLTVTGQHAGFFHVLQIVNLTETRFGILKVTIDECDLRKLLYLSYSEDQQGRRRQPATELFEPGQRWVLPFACPVSGWLETVGRKLPNNVFGQDLMSESCFYYPQSRILDEQKFPKIVCDFYKHNFDFSIIDRTETDPCKIPFMRYNKTMDPDLLDQARQQIQDLMPMVFEQGINYTQYSSNIEEYSKSFWRVVWLKQNHKYGTDMAAQFDKVLNLIDSLDLDTWHVFIGVLPPGGFIYPHKDHDTHKATSDQYKFYQGCTALYIPIVWPENNYIKFAGVGTLPIQQDQPMVINNDFFTHCVINDSQENRVVIGVRAHQDILADSQMIDINNVCNAGSF